MSVQTYIYPSDSALPAVDQILNHCRAKLGSIALTELECKTPMNWTSLTLIHASEPELSFSFWTIRNTKSNIEDLRQRYQSSPNLPTVAVAKKFICAQHKGNINIPLKRFRTNWAAFVSVIAEIAAMCDGVIDSPENERLFSVRGFQRHISKHC